MSALDEDDIDAIRELTRAVSKLANNVGESQAATTALLDEVTAIGDELPTKRERAVFAIAQGLAAREGVVFDDIAAEAVVIADELLAELAKPVDAKEGAT